MKPFLLGNTLRSSFALAFAAMALLVSPTRAQTTLYWAGGTTNITDGTTIPTNFTTLSGNWDLTTKNFATATNGTTYQAWSNGSIFRGFFGGWNSGYTNDYARITNTADVSVSGISVAMDKGVGSGNKWVDIGATNARTLTLLAGTVIDVRGSGAQVGGDGDGVNMGLYINQASTNLTLAGSNGFTKTGNYVFRLNGNHNGLTGTVNILHGANLIDNNGPGTVTLDSTGSLAGITRFNVSAMGYSVGTSTNFGNLGRLYVIDNSNNQINDAAVVNLSGVGIFRFTGSANSTETMGSLRLNSGGVLQVSDNGNGGTLAITNGIDRANNRAQLSVVVTSAGTNGTTVNLGSNHGLGTNVLVPWISDATTARFGMVDASNNLAWVTPTDVTGNVSSITDINANYRIVGNSTTFGANTNFASGAAANTLAFYRSNNASPVTVRITDTLTIGSGGIVVANVNSNLDATIEGINGTSLTTSNNAPLYISSGFNTAGGALNINAPITGTMDVVKGGQGGVKFGGTNQANTYTGTTYINGGTLAIGKSTGTTAINGNVVIRNGGILDMDTSDQIVNTATVTVENGGYFKTDNFNETIANLAGGGMLHSTVTTTTNSFTVNSSVAPGDGGIGTLTLNLGTTGGTNSFFRMNTNAVFNMELSAAGGLTGDRVDFYNYNAGELLLVGSNAINLTLLGTKTPGTYTNTIFRFYSDNGTTLTNSGISSGLSIGTWSTNDFASTPTISYNGTTIDLAYQVVPEPSTIALLGLGGIALAAYRLRRRNR